MLKLLRVKATDFLSYGNLDLDITKFSLCQLVADNGAGKTNILTVITEALYGKNPRGYAKGELFNRNVNATKFSISVLFETDEGVFLAETIRNKATAKVTLSKNGEDITQHTSKATFADIERIIGLDYELFLQYVYQSSKFSTEFLTATPATRKQFLSKMLGLDNINTDIDAVSVFIKDIKTKENIVRANRRVAEATLPATAYDTVLDLQELRTYLDEVEDRYEQQLKQKATFDMFNVRKNELEFEVKIRSKKLRDLLEPSKPIAKPTIDKVDIDLISYEKVKGELAVVTKEITDTTLELGKLDRKLSANLKTKPSTSCHVCGSSLHNDNALKIHEASIAELEAEIETLRTNYNSLVITKSDLGKAIKDTDTLIASNKKADEVEVYNSNLEMAYKNSLDTYTSTLTRLTDELVVVEEKLSKLETVELPSNENLAVKRAELSRKLALAEQSNKDLTKKIEVENQLKKLQLELDTLAKQVAVSQILLDSLKQLLARTIENGLRSLEISTNKYLVKFGSKAIINFDQDDNKVLVKVGVRSGSEITIVNYYTLSTGQAARVSIATLLAMRDLLASKVNLLILDEVVGTLDSEGKESLIDILTGIHGMNIFLVSHDWTHPLLEKIEVKTSPKGSFISYG